MRSNETFSAYMALVGGVDNYIVGFHIESAGALAMAKRYKKTHDADGIVSVQRVRLSPDLYNKVILNNKEAF